MKKTLLATAIISGLVSATAGAATVYDQDGTTMKIGGRAEVRGLFSDSVEGTMKDKSRARINFGGETQISDTLTGFGFMEYEISPEAKSNNKDNGDDDTSYLKNRYLFAGIGTQIGDFSYGKQDTANVQVSNMTDISSYHSRIQQAIDSTSERQSNTFLYSGTFADALTVQVDYQAVEDKDMDAYSASAFYAFDFGLDLAASYADQDEQNQATLAAAYTWNDLYVSASYAVGDYSADTDFTSVEAAIQYKFTKEFRMIGILGMADMEANSVSVDTEDFFALEAQYRFNKSIRTIASYKINNLDGAENELIVGLRYNF